MCSKQASGNVDGGDGAWGGFDVDPERAGAPVAKPILIQVGGVFAQLAGVHAATPHFFAR
jgi:hypothetical protein